jgi:signal transduction histidine kinase
MPLSPTSRVPRRRPALEDQLARLEEQLGNLRVQVRQAQQLSVLGVGAVTLAHEIKNVLSSMLGYAQYARSKDDADLTRKALDVAINRVQVLESMSSRLLRISAAKHAEAEEVSVRVALDSAIETMVRSLDKDGITLRIDVSPTLTCVSDALHLQQVFFNLILNAREALLSRRGGTIRVTAETDGDTVLIRVADNGGGIPAHELPYIFDPLHSTKPSRGDHDARCRGLGLPLCRDIVCENGGSLDVETSLGQGTTFVIRLPAALPAEREAEAALSTVR